MAPGPLTVFAPNDDAFAEVLKTLGTTKLGLLELANLGDILKNHVVAGAVMSTDLKEGQARPLRAAQQRPLRARANAPRLAPQEVTMLSGKKVKITLAGGAKVNGIAITKADIKATNGVIHAIKSVIV